MSPVEWCEQMERSAKDGEEAYVYFQLKQLWEKRENEQDSEGVHV